MLKRKKDGKKMWKKLSCFDDNSSTRFDKTATANNPNHRRVDRRHTANLGRCRMAQYSTVAIDLTYWLDCPTIQCPFATIENLTEIDKKIGKLFQSWVTIDIL